MKAKSLSLRQCAASALVIGTTLIFMPPEANACVNTPSEDFFSENCYLDGAASSAIVETALDALNYIVDDAIESDLGLANGTPPAGTAPFGVFASGQWAHTDHDGFSISNGPLTIAGPSFDVDEFSAAVSVDFNAAKHFGFDSEHGLNIGVFGGYASADLDVDPSGFFDGNGDAENESGMFGGYGLYRRGTTYALVAVSAFLGETDVDSDAFGGSGSYDTDGYAITGSVGRIFNVSDRVRLDLRGGLLGVDFTGDAYTDSDGRSHGESRLSFGAVKFDPGVYADYQLQNGMVISPYARLDMQQRFDYSNTASVRGDESEFDDADFSAALSAGFNLKMSALTTFSSEIRGKWSDDSSAVSGKLGLKIAF